MKNFIWILMFLVLLRFCAGSKKTLPVLMIDHDQVMSRMVIEPNPFELTNSEFFIDLTLEAGKRSECVIIFLEDTLCTEDISTKDSLGTPFYNLQRGIEDEKVIYMPAVTEPFGLFRQVFEPSISNIFRVGSGEKLRIIDEHKYMYIYFQDDAEMNRLETLRKHDMLMKEVYFTVRQMKAGPVLAFYTGKRNPITFEQLNYSPNSDWEPPQERGVMVVTPEVLFRLSGVYSMSQTRRSSFEETPFVEYEMRTRRTLSTTMAVTDYHLQFNFEFEDLTWRLGSYQYRVLILRLVIANVALLEAGEEVGRTETVITAPWQRSYYCSEPITIFNMRDGSSFVISEYQVEPLSETRRFEDESDEALFLRQQTTTTTLGTTSGSTSTETPGYCYFSKAINCGPYFNTGILSGLYISAIFLLITVWGVTMIINCGRNDRHDDPDQKSLVIAQEVGGGGL